MSKRIPITKWFQEEIRHKIKNPSLCIDATAGTGQDTVFLCDLCGKDGRVIAMDIQETAIARTRERLEKEGLLEQVTLVLDSHEAMDQYAEAQSVDFIMFNLGYLPGGDHKMATRPEVTIRAIEKGLTLLKEDGMIGLMIYSGGDSGFEERDAVLEYLKALDSHKYTVIVQAFYNKPNNPPIPAFICR